MHRHAHTLFDVNYPSLVSRADLTYTEPVKRSEEGQPVGNGHMGSLVWTTPDALKFQLNRCDVFSAGCNTRSFPQAGADYSSGCGMVDIRVAELGDEVFAGTHFKQHLAVYDGRVEVSGECLTAQVTTWQNGDVMAVEIDDQRQTPATINVDLRKLRYATQWVDARNWELSSRHASEVLRGEHSSVSRLDIQDGRIILTQQFREGDFYSASAVAIAAVGRTSHAGYYNETTVRLSVRAGSGKVSLLMASAASFDPHEDVARKAIQALDAAETRGMHGILAENTVWWDDYWSKAFVRLHSEDGEADFVEFHYTYFLYIMASASRGSHMVHFNGMLWFTNGDLRQWGSQYWWHNSGCYYNGLTPANRPELLAPMFRTYSRCYDSYANAARQQWGSQGVWIPETTWFDGLEDLPEDIGAELQDLYLTRKPWSERSDAFMAYARNKQTFNSRWNWGDYEQRGEDGEYADKGKGPFGHVTHTFASTAKIAYLYWLHYAYHLDKEWLRTTGYPMIKGVVELYRNFPNVRKGEDGKYHIYNVNNQESDWNTQDTSDEVTAMHALTPLAVRASEVLDVDDELRRLWVEFYENLVELPAGGHPARYYDLVTVANPNTKSFKDSRQALRDAPVDADLHRHVLSRDPLAAANLGLSDLVKVMIPAQIRTIEIEGCDTWGVGPDLVGVMRNRLGMREGPGCQECQRLGNAANALHNALLQTAGETQGADAIIRVFPAWPRAWDAQFTLAAPGAFLVSASIEKGVIRCVQIHSNAGGVCRLCNPWPGTPMTLYRDGIPSDTLEGDIVCMASHESEMLVLVPQGETPRKTRVQ